MDRKKILIIVMIIIVTLTLIIFATAKIRAKAKEGETIIHEGENVSNTTEPTEVVIKISDDEKSKEEKEKDALKEKYDYLKNDNNGYEKKMSEEDFEKFIDYTYKYNEEHKGIENADYTPISKYIENICGKYIGFEVTEEVINRQENNMNQLKEENLQEEIMNDYFNTIMQTVHDSLVRNYGEEYINSLEKQVEDEYATGNYKTTMSPSALKQYELMYEIYIDTNKIEEKEIPAFFTRFLNTRSRIERTDEALAEKINKAIDPKEGLYNNSELEEKYRYYYMPRYDELYKQ